MSSEYNKRILNRCKPLENDGKVFNGAYTQGFNNKMNSTQTYWNCVNNYKNSNSNSNEKNISDGHSFPTNYPSVNSMHVSHIQIGVNLGHIPF